MDELSVEIGQVEPPLFGGTGRRRDSHQTQLKRWIADTLDIAARLASASTMDAQGELLPLFWIRLYGLLTDVSDFVELTVEQSYDGMFPLARTRNTRSPLPLALARLKAVFEEDELLYIEYRRHAECDPFQTKYRTRRLPHGGEAHVPSLLLDGRPITVEVARAKFQSLLARHASREERVGSAFAGRALPALHAALAAARGEAEARELLDVK